MIDSLLDGKYLLATVLITIFFILPYIFYLIFMQATFQKISAANRKMNPSGVWIALIPLYGAIWHFYIVTAMADSLRAELHTHKILLPEPRPGYQLGIAACILLAAAVIPGMGGAFFIAGYIIWILYWIKISSYRNKLNMSHRLNLIEKTESETTDHSGLL